MRARRSSGSQGRRMAGVLRCGSPPQAMRERQRTLWFCVRRLRARFALRPRPRTRTARLPARPPLLLPLYLLLALAWCASPLAGGLNSNAVQASSVFRPPHVPSLLPQHWRSHGHGDQRVRVTPSRRRGLPARARPCCEGHPSVALRQPRWRGSQHNTSAHLLLSFWSVGLLACSLATRAAPALAPARVALNIAPLAPPRSRASPGWSLRH